MTSDAATPTAADPDPEPWAGPRGARRRRRRVGCIVGLSIALVVLLGGAALADGVTRSIAEDVAADAVRTAIDTSGDVTVQIDGTPFLTQLVAGSLDQVQLHADAATLSDLQVTDLDAVVTDIAVREPRSAGLVVATATVPLSQIEQTLEDQTGWDLTASVDGETLIASGDLAGVAVSASLTLAAAGTAGVTATLQSVTLAGVAVDPATLPDGLGSRLTDLGSLTGDVLADGSVTAVQVQDDGVRVTVQLEDVDVASL
ncbi:MAG TPA: DUF2993 domain-containing protein [Cellulomonas sp.]